MTDDIQFSDLKHRAVIEEDVRTPDGAGGFDVVHQSVAEVWAAIRPRAVRERVQEDRVSGTATHDIWMRYRNDIRSDMRVRLGDRVFHIIGVLDVDFAQRWIKCPAEERRL